MNDKKKFWAVCRENCGGVSQKRHETFEAARQEAERLAQKENARFFVLEVIGIVVPVQTPVKYLPIDEI